MTYIEFFTLDRIENICSSFTKPAERVVLIGDKIDFLEKHALLYHDLLAAKGIETKFISRSVNKNDLRNIVDVLSDIIETYDDCVFDLTGGEELYLVATGIVFQKYRDRNLQMHRFNIRNNTIVDCDQDGHTILEAQMPALTVPEFIELYGGKIISDQTESGYNAGWDMNEAFQRDVRAMWEICRKNVVQWNYQADLFSFAETLRETSPDPLTVTASVPNLKTYMAQREKPRDYKVYHTILESLYQAGLLKSYYYDEASFSVTYKNEQIQNCLTVAGRALELKMYLAALQAFDKKGKTVYNSVMTGVFIDWDGNIHTKEEHAHDTKNEIDVIMMHGMVPVFVSCKNGRVKMDELYKLNSVALKFGGKYAKKVLVATSLERAKEPEYIRERADDMGIFLLEGVQYMEDPELNKTVRLLWSSQQKKKPPKGGANQG